MRFLGIVTAQSHPMTTRRIAFVFLTAIGTVPAAAQGIPGQCHLMLKPSYGASVAEHARYQSEMTACLAQPAPPRFELDTSIYRQATPLPAVNPLERASQAARLAHIRAQTEALRAQTDALRVARRTP